MVISGSNPEQSFESQIDIFKTKIEQGDADTIAKMENFSTSKNKNFSF
ncbi:MAG: hypothetical protein ACK521_04270 [bacterium]